MAALVFETFLGCIELRRGCFIIGYLYLLAFTCISLILGLGIEGFVDDVLVAQDVEKEKESLLLLLLSGAMLLLALLMFAFIISLLIGLHLHKRSAVLAFLIGAFGYMLLDPVTFGVGSLFDNTAGRILFRLVAFIVESYCLNVIRSYYCKMNKGPAYITA